MIQIVKYLYNFFTIWSLTLYIIFLLITNLTHFNIPIYITHFITSIIISNSIWGSIITNYKKYEIQKIINTILDTNVDIKMIYLKDFIFHIIPLIHVILYKDKYINRSTNTSNSFIKSMLLLLLFSLIYLSQINITNTYFNINRFILIIPPLIIYTFNLYKLNL